MAVLIATANGNLTAAATWGVVDATSLSDSEANNTALTLAYVESSTSTPGAITVDGIALKVASRGAVASGTMSVRISQAGALVAGTEVTINISDVPSRDIGWLFFKFAAPVTLLAATLYTVASKTSVVAMINLYRDGTAGNWSRMLRTTTTGAPAAGDNMFICGEWTAAGTKTDRTVTMNQTAATDYGGASTTLAGFGISKGGTLAWATTAATNFLLRLSALLVIQNGGAMTMGTGGTPCPRDSSMQLEFDCAVDGDFGLKVFGTLSAQGLSRTSGKNIVRCKLNTDEAVAQTVLGVDTDTGWLSGDDIAIAATTQTASQAETRTLNGNAAATTVTVSAGLTNAHSGTSPTQAEVLLLTRNVRIRSVSSTFMAYLYCGVVASIDCDWTEFRYLGASGTGKRGIEIDTATGSIALSFCSLREFDNHGIITVAADWDNLSIDNLTGWKVGHQSTGQAAILIAATTGVSWSLTNIDVISGNTGQGVGVEVRNGKGNISGIRCNSGGGDGFLINLAPASGSSFAIDGVWTDFELHANNQSGLRINSGAGGLIQNVNAWRNNSATTHGGIFCTEAHGRFIVQGGSVFGNATVNIEMTTSGDAKRFYFRNMVIAGDTTFATANGFRFPNNNSSVFVTFENCTFGVASGILVAHSTVDIEIRANDRYAELLLIHVLLASATEINNSSRLKGRSVIAYQRVDQVTNVHKRVYPSMGTVSYDTVLFRSASPAEKMAPSAATFGLKLESGPKRVSVASGATVAISAYVQKDVAFNGNAPRLMLRANPALGITSDTVIATFSAAASVWQQLSGVTAAASEAGVFEFYVDVDGTAGQINVDDWSAT